jgi:DNA-binding protein YbaB
MAIDDPGGDLLNPDDALERLAAWRNRIDRVAADTKIMSEQLQLLRVTEADGNGLAEVTIDSTGALVDLRLSRQIQRVAPEVVARTIMTTVRAAKAKLADRSQEIIADTMGTDPAAQAVAERVGRQLRGPDPEADPEHPGDTRNRW